MKNAKFLLKNRLLFGFRQTQGKSEHLNYYKKNPTSDIKTMFFTADIRSRIFGTAFPIKKSEEKGLEIFLIFSQRE
jgi:hypothetical protein